MTPEKEVIEYLIKLNTTDSNERTEFKKNPVKAMRTAKLSNKNMVLILSGELLTEDSGLPASTHVQPPQLQITVVYPKKK